MPGTRDENNKKFDEKYELKENTYIERINDLGWGVDYDERVFFKTLYNGTRNHLDPVFTAMLDETLSVDIWDRNKRKETLERFIKQINDYPLPEEKGPKRSFLNTIKKNLKKLRPDAEEKDLDELRARNKKRHDEVAEEKRQAEFSQSFLEETPKMGWREEDKKFLGYMNQMREAIIDTEFKKKFEEAQRRIMTTKIDPEKYYSGRNKMLNEIYFLKGGNSSLAGYKFKQASDWIYTELKATRDLQKYDDRMEDKKDWIEAAKKNGWNSPDDDELLNVIFDARFDKDKKTSRDLEELLVDFKKRFRGDDFSERKRLLTRVSLKLGDVNARSEEQKKALNLLKNVDLGLMRFLENDFSPDNEQLIPPKNEVKDPVIARLRIMIDVLRERRVMKIIENSGIGLRAFTETVCKRLNELCAEALQTPGLSGPESRYFSKIRDKFYSQNNLKIEFHTGNEKDFDLQLGKADELIAKIMQDGLKDYPNLDEAGREAYEREKSGYLALGKSSGWTDVLTDDQDLLGRLFAARYDSEGKVIEAIDLAIRQLAINDDEPAQSRSARLNAILTAITDAVPDEANRTTAQKNAIKRIGKALEDASKITLRKDYLTHNGIPNWLITTETLSLIHDLDNNVIEGVPNGRLRKLFDEMESLKNKTYPQLTVERDGRLIHLQSSELLERFRQEILKIESDYHPEVKRRALAAIGAELEELREEAEKEKSLLPTIEAEIEKKKTEKVSLYMQRIRNMTEQDLIAFERVSDGFIKIEHRDRSVEATVKKAIIARLKKVAVMKAELEAAKNDPGSDRAKQFMDELWNLEQALEDYQRQIPMANWSYNLMKTVETLYPDRYEPYKDIAARLAQVRERTLKYKDTITKMKEGRDGSLSEIASLVTNPPNGAENAPQLFKVLMLGRTLSQSGESLAAAKTEYDSLGAEKIKNLMLSVDDALNSYLRITVPEKIHPPIVTLISKYFPERHRELQDRINRAAEYRHGKEAFLQKCAANGWNQPNDRFMLSKIYDAGITRRGYLVGGEDALYAKELEKFAALSRKDSEAVYASLDTLISYIGGDGGDDPEFGEVSRTQVQEDAVSLLEQQKGKIFGIVAKIWQKRGEEEKDNAAISKMAAERFGMPEKLGEEQINAQRIAENAENEKDDRIDSHFRRRAELERFLANMGWRDKGDIRFFGELYDQSIDKNGNPIGGNNSIASKIRRIGIAAKTQNTGTIEALMEDILNDFGAINENDLTDAQKAVKSKLEAKIEEFKKEIKIGGEAAAPDEGKQAFMQGAGLFFLDDEGRKKLLGSYYDAQFDASGNIIPQLSGLLKQCVGMTDLQQLNDLNEKWKEEIEKIPFNERTPVQRELSYYPSELRYKRSLLENAKEPDYYLSQGWNAPGDKEFWDIMKECGKDAEGNEIPEFIQNMDSLTAVSKSQLWLVIPRLQAMQQALNAVPRDKRTDKQNQAIELLGGKIDEFDNLNQELRNQLAQEKSDAAKRADGPSIRGEKTDKDQIYPERIADGSDKMHLWADPKVNKANLLRHMTVPAAKIAERLGNGKKESYDEINSEIIAGGRIKNINSLGRSEAYREWGPGPLSDRRINITSIAQESDIQWVDDKLKELSGIYSDMTHEVESQEIKRYYNGFVYALDDSYGNFLQAISESSYLDRLFIAKTSNGLRKENDPDNMLKGLKGIHPAQHELPGDEGPEDISDDYMNLLCAFEKELDLEYQKQRLQREGYANEESAAEFKAKLKRIHEEIIGAYDRLYAIEDNGQYDEYLEKPLNWMTGKNNDPATPGLGTSVGCMRGELKAIDLGWDIREIGVMGTFGAINAAYEKMMVRAAGDPAAVPADYAEISMDIASLKMNLWDLDTQAGQASKYDGCEELYRFIQKYRDNDIFKDVIKDNEKKFESSRSYVRNAYLKSLPEDQYRREDAELFDQMVDAYKLAEGISENSKAFDERVTGLEWAGHTDSAQYTALAKAVHALKTIGKGATPLQITECLKRVSETAQAYENKLGTFEGIFGKGGKRLSLARDAKRYADQQLGLIEPKLDGLDPFTSVGEQAYAKAKDAPDIAAGRKNPYFIGAKKEENGAFSIRKNVFELIEADDPEMRLARVTAIDGAAREKQQLADGMQRAREKARNKNRSHLVNIDEMINEGGNAPANASAKKNTASGRKVSSKSPKTDLKNTGDNENKINNNPKTGKK